ncbi:hypothetical protein [Ferrimonas marina]|uniref:Phage abortive infection protein n=1 Tax=Ferrimonas marina TaxID=299255 RepID=A0A1M5X8R1_9GAMM|nr:hypothetical protein [Ferrimonas marina]SHH95894.1 hypothetical protein SAMN02745129_3311 [Ferrimonas marina]
MSLSEELKPKWVFAMGVLIGSHLMVWTAGFFAIISVAKLWGFVSGGLWDIFQGLGGLATAITAIIAYRKYHQELETRRIEEKRDQELRIDESILMLARNLRPPSFHSELLVSYTMFRRIKHEIYEREAKTAAETFGVVLRQFIRNADAELLAGPPLHAHAKVVFDNYLPDRDWVEMLWQIPEEAHNEVVEIAMRMVANGRFTLVAIDDRYFIAGIDPLETDFINEIVAEAQPITTNFKANTADFTWEQEYFLDLFFALQNNWLSAYIYLTQSPNGRSLLSAMKQYYDQGNEHNDHGR